MTRVATRAMPARATTLDVDVVAHRASRRALETNRDARGIRSRQTRVGAAKEDGDGCRARVQRDGEDAGAIERGERRAGAVALEDFDDALEALEETLLGADFGPKAAMRSDGRRARARGARRV